MSVFVDLVALYEGAGFTVQSSLSPAHFPGTNGADVPFSYLFGPNGRACKGGGIALAEIAFFESLCERARPKRIFIIGNAFGWSTLALALINRSARVVAIDYCPRPEEEHGLEVTNMLARLAGPGCLAIDMAGRFPSSKIIGIDLSERMIEIAAENMAKGKSPDNVAAICAREFDGPVELAFIDGGHTNAQQSLDFAACRAVATEGTVYVLHDVINFGMVESFVEIARDNPDLIASLLLRTPSGMGICYPATRAVELAPVVRAFTETEPRAQALREEGRRRLAEGRKG